MKSIYLWLSILVISCSPPVVFDQAYPTDKPDLVNIPVSYRGIFICESDSTLVRIQEHHITIERTDYFDMTIKQAEEREDCRILDDKMYVTGRQECIPIEMINDSVVRGTVKEIDTLFVMQQGSIGRLYRGHLILSQEVKDKQWSISLLSLEGGGDITYKSITDRTKIKNLARITETTEITTPQDKHPRYRIQPTMKEFDALLNDDRIFIQCEYLIKFHSDTIHLN